jgi:hypothetical protein
VNAVLDFYNANLAVRNLDKRYGTTTMERLIHEAMIRKACTLLGAFDSKGAHSGAVSLLIWSAMRIAMKRELSLDFDGGSTAGILKFLGGVGGRLVRRFEVERTMPLNAALRTILHGASAITAAARPAQWRGEASEPQRI